MPATVQIHEMVSAGVGVDKTDGTTRFKAAVSTTVDTSNPIQIPTAGTTYSYTKELQVYIANTAYTQVSDLAAYTDGANTFGTAIMVYYDVQGSFVAHTNANIAGTDIFTKNSGSTIDMDAINTGPFTSTGYKGDILRMQMAVGSTATSGALTAETLTISYQEI